MAKITDQMVDLRPMMQNLNPDLSQALGQAVGLAGMVKQDRVKEAQAQESADIAGALAGARYQQMVNDPELMQKYIRLGELNPDAAKVVFEAAVAGDKMAQAEMKADSEGAKLFYNNFLELYQNKSPEQARAFASQYANELSAQGKDTSKIEAMLNMPNDQMGGEALRGAAMAGVALDIEEDQAKKQQVLKPGEAVYDPDTGEVLYENPKETARATAKDANGILRYEDSGEKVFPNVTKEQEATPGATAKDANGRLRYVNSGILVFPNVTVKPQKGKALTEAQKKDKLFGGRIKRANTQMNKTFQGQSIDNKVAELGGIESTKWDAMLNNSLTRKDVPSWYQQYDTARRNFVTAVLRKESGAAISDSEFIEANKLYFAQPGDSPDTVLQKRELREYVQSEFIAGGGPYESPQEPAAAPQEPVVPQQPVQAQQQQAGDPAAVGQSLQTPNGVSFKIIP